ncbi:MAG: GNAT family N-acetyltransferase [Actinomycetota bacterium]
MGRRIVDVDLENFARVPRDCRQTVFWELDHDDRAVNARFQKEEWFSSTLLEWGPCGKLLLDPAVPDPAVPDPAAPDPAAPGIGFAQYAPSTLFPRRLRFTSGAATSDDALYLAYVYVEEGHRGEGLGSALVRDVARATADRGFDALEVVGDRRWDGSWVLPVTFLAANGFRVVVDDERFPLLRLDIRARTEPLRSEAALTLPQLEPPGVG